VEDSSRRAGGDVRLKFGVESWVFDVWPAAGVFRMWARVVVSLRRCAGLNVKPQTLNAKHPTQSGARISCRAGIFR
jgi:hypothetical protein